MSLCACGGQQTTVESFYHVGPGDRTQVVRVGEKCLYTVSHLTD